jgi:hypothetical protein
LAIENHFDYFARGKNPFSAFVGNGKNDDSKMVTAIVMSRTQDNILIINSRNRQLSARPRGIRN